MLRTRTEPSVWMVYAIKCIAHYHHHTMADDMHTPPARRARIDRRPTRPDDRPHGPPPSGGSGAYRQVFTFTPVVFASGSDSPAALVAASRIVAELGSVMVRDSATPTASLSPVWTT